MGGRKKSSKKVVKKKKAGLSSLFKCPFCNNSDVVECTINTKENIGTLMCRICGAKYQTTTNYLTKPIDIFCEWIDECEEVNGVAEEVRVQDHRNRTT